MSFSTEYKIWQLKQDAKWGRDIETQRRAIQELGKIGDPAQEILKEIIAVSSRDDIRRYCQGAINDMTSNKVNEIEKERIEKKTDAKEKEKEKEKEQTSKEKTNTAQSQ